MNFSSVLSKQQIDKYAQKFLPFIRNSIYSFTFDDYHIGRTFFDQTRSIRLENLSQIKLIDHGIDLQDDFLGQFRPETLNLVITSFNQTCKPCKLLSTSIKRLHIEFETGDDAKHYLANHLEILSTSVLVHMRIIFSKLSEYFQLFQLHLPIHLEKLYVSIFSIDKSDYHRSLIFPYLLDYQLEICQIPFYLIQFLLPSSTNLQRLAFIGQTTTIKAKSWKILLSNYLNLERFDLHLSQNYDVHYSDIQEWKYEFPKYSVDYNSLKNSFRINSSKFDRLDRLYLNESIENFHHIDYSNEISHLIIRSQYWCSYFDLSLNLQNELYQRFKFIKRLSTTIRQLEYFLRTNFLTRIQQLDLEFPEKYCFIPNELVEKLPNVKSIYLSSMYDGTQDLSLHTVIKELLLEKFSQINYLYIDAVRIIDEENVQESISSWYSSRIKQPYVKYLLEKSLSIWF
ncbi:unnamed protein product [Adineta ricciae]|uniref:Uncharacterized protein n=1 Tax=Adineta ricciae TaxID=249248 RepID=A0A814H3L0_ADIRI|nr:unnamed protein product [Adineta ricciae]